MSLHHIGVARRSKANTSDESRIGFAARFIAAEVKQEVENPMAMLLRGADRHGNFELLEAPRDTEPEAAEARRDEIIPRMHSNLLPEE